MASAPARVVTVSSGAQSMGRIDLDDLQGERSYNGQRAYNQSKLANVLFTYELARRLDGTGVTANVLHPGVVRTVVRPRGHGSAACGCMLPLVKPFMKTPEQGAATPIHLASSPEVEGVTGRLLRQAAGRSSPSKASYDATWPRAALGGQRSARGLRTRPRTPVRHEGPDMKLGVHLVNFTLPGGPASIGPTLAATGSGGRGRRAWTTSR